MIAAMKKFLKEKPGESAFVDFLIQFSVLRPGWSMSFAFLGYGIAAFYIAMLPAYREIPSLFGLATGQIENLIQSTGININVSPLALPVFTIFMGFGSALNTSHKVNLIVAGVLIVFSIYGYVTAFFGTINPTVFLISAVYGGIGLTAIQISVMSLMIIRQKKQVEEFKNEGIDALVAKRYGEGEDSIVLSN